MKKEKKRRPKWTEMCSNTGYKKPCKGPHFCRKISCVLTRPNSSLNDPRTLDQIVEDDPPLERR